MKLYDFEKSGNCYKVKLFLSILGMEYTKILVNLKNNENMADEFLAMNPNGLVPVLIDGSVTIYDSAAILCYLAKTHAEESWLPNDPVQFANVIRWLAFEQSEGRFGLARARAIAINGPTMLARIGTLEESQTVGKMGLDILEKQLAGTKWLAAGDKPTIGDIACYPYTAMAPQGKISLEPYPAINRWMNDIKNLHGYIELPE